MNTAWSPVQRSYLEAMGYELLHVVDGRQALTPMPPATEALAISVADTHAIEARQPDALPEASPARNVPELSARLQAHLSRAAGMPFDVLVTRAWFPPDLAGNPHAKRAFWHVLKGVRKA